jgi:hypothetical protein
LQSLEVALEEICVSILPQNGQTFGVTIDSEELRTPLGDHTMQETAILYSLFGIRPVRASEVEDLLPFALRKQEFDPLNRLGEWLHLIIISNL